MAERRRERILDAVLTEVAAHGLGELTVEAVAGRAGSSRATVYRYFPGGRDELVGTTLRREVDRFLASLMDQAPPTTDIVDHIGGLLTGARRLLAEHAVLQRLLHEEAEAFVPSLATIQPRVQEALAVHLRSVLAADASAQGLDAGVDAAADHAARMLLSYVGSRGRVDVGDPVAVRDVVRRHIVPGL